MEIGINLIIIVPIRIPNDPGKHCSCVLVFLPHLTLQPQFNHPIHLMVKLTTQELILVYAYLNHPQALRPCDPIQHFFFEFFLALLAYSL